MKLGVAFSPLPCLDLCSFCLQVTPGLGVIAALLILLVVKEPVRGSSDGQRQSKGVKGKSGLSAYYDDIKYLLKKLVDKILHTSTGNLLEPS